MRESDKKEIFNEAIKRLTDEIVAKAQPDNPVPYARRVHADLADRHYQTARDLFAQHGELTADELHGLLYDADHPAATPQKPTVRYHTDTDECRTCESRGGGGWLLVAPRDDTGMTDDLVPCPTCAPDRHRLHEHQTGVQRDDRSDWRERYRRTVTDLQAKAEPTPDPNPTKETA